MSLHVDGSPKDYRQRSASFGRKTSKQENRDPAIAIATESSAAIISDEYERKDNKDFAVEIFYSAKEEKTFERLQKTLTDLHFSVCEHEFRTTEKFLEDLHQCDIKNKSGLLVIVLSVQRKFEEMGGILFPDEEETDLTNGIEIKDVWTSFLDKKELNDKPKIFLIHTYEFKEIEKDNLEEHDIAQFSFDIPPPGADFLLVYHTTKDPKKGFLKNLCDNIRSYGDKHNLMDHIAVAADDPDNNDLSTPLTVSTLTRHFYVTHSASRGIISEMMDNARELMGSKKAVKRSRSVRMTPPSAKKLGRNQKTTTDSVSAAHTESNSKFPLWLKGALFVVVLGIVILYFKA